MINITLLHHSASILEPSPRIIQHFSLICNKCSKSSS
uniref:Uncharacterized protein n=1 Tax=Lepeophtheirus salmonis TaxID=72036 RepID=A0A0K2TF52_LEPSM